MSGLFKLRKSLSVILIFIGAITLLACSVEESSTSDDSNLSLEKEVPTSSSTNHDINPLNTLPENNQNVLPSKNSASIVDTQTERENLSQKSCESLWSDFIPYDTVELPSKIKSRLRQMKYGVQHIYYPTPFDFDHDGEDEIILIDNIGYSQVLGGQGSHLIIVKIDDFNPKLSIEEQLLSSKIEVESTFISNLIHTNLKFEMWEKNSESLRDTNTPHHNVRRYRLESDLDDLPEFDRGRVQFGQIGDQTVVKINADTYGTRMPSGMNPRTYVRPYDVLAQFQNPHLLRIFCIKKLY